MRAMILNQIGKPLELVNRAVPTPGPAQVRLRVSACGVCRTDLHLVDGDLPDTPLPRIPGHQVVGVVDARGPGAERFDPGTRVGVPWLGETDGTCAYCRSGRENLCDHARFTGYQLDGGYAEYMLANQAFCLPLPERYSDLAAAPLLCAGLIGYRAYRMIGDAHRLGFYGFGNAARILAQVARHQGREFYAFTRPGDDASQQAARRLGAAWAGGSDQPPPVTLDAAILFAPVGALVPTALAAVARGGIVVCAEIHMSDIPSFPYRVLWEERVVRSVANLTREDGHAFLSLAARVPIETDVEPYPLTEANTVLDAMRRGALRGTAVLVP